MTIHLQFPDAAAQQKYLATHFQYTVVRGEPNYADHYDANVDTGYQEAFVRHQEHEKCLASVIVSFSVCIDK